MPDTEASHFWLGHFPTEELAAAYFAAAGAAGRARSRFARDQGEARYDPDLLEFWFDDAAASVVELAAHCSWFDQWAAELAGRAADIGLAGVNTVAFIRRDQIDAPQSVRGDGYWLRYLGTIRYEL